MYRFALRPRWLLSHLFVLVLVVALVNLGLWQLRRLDERRARNASVVARTEQPARPVDAVVATVGDVAEARYRPATDSGRYRGSSSFLVDNRSLDGLPGAWALTPLEREDGSVLFVNRGFAPFEDGEARPPAPPAGEVSVTGTLVPWDDASCGIRRGAGSPGRVLGAACLSLEAARGALGEDRDVAPVVLQLRSSTPPGPGGLSPVPPPEMGEGSHLSYAFQWFTFATIAAGGYLLILRKNARERAGRPRAAAGDGGDDLDAELQALLAAERAGREPPELP